MERRSFLKGIASLIGGIAINEAIPLGRVWSFPKTIKPLNIERGIPIRYIRNYDLFHDRMICQIDTLDLPLPMAVHTAIRLDTGQVEIASRAHLIDKHLSFIASEIRKVASELGPSEMIQWFEGTDPVFPKTPYPLLKCSDYSIKVFG